MLLPYRAKNPPEHFPYATVALIAINTLKFVVTSDSLLTIREDVVDKFAVSHDTLSLFRMVSAMFLHGSILHLAGNMLFLWIFGASTEGRLRPLKFVALYLLSGLAGDLLHDLAVGFSHPSQFSLGASGAIMGVAGMYLYMFPYSMICVLYRRWYGWGFGVAEWHARWVVAVYIGIDLLEGFLTKSLGVSDGVGHFAHLGGFGVGLLGAWALRARRDSEEVSTVQATRAEMKDFSLLSYRDLETLVQQPTEDMNLILAYCERALTDHTHANPQRCVEVLNQHIKALMEKADVQRLVWILLTIHPHYGGVHPLYYLRLASRLEAQYSNDYASRLYHRVYELNPNAPDTESALFRLARLNETAFNNRQQAYNIYCEMLRRFPNGSMALDVRQTLKTQYGVAV
jgi:membrane associated rhomboid family serine protease